ncbi:MAG TPA: HEAT repeat domain-containing protein [Thermoanaerobaculia bacterium]|jgi:hypothetical protein|nr:HEAT repeat domain-containing protein [Thermoanaerobaculia bacterium]
MIAEMQTSEPRVEAAAAPESPYKFLDYFTESPKDRRRFGGRDREIHDLVTRITNRRTLVVYGPSGIGKTSLLLAGVFPALRERGYRPVYIRLLTSPVTDLLREVAEACGLGAAVPCARETLVRATQAGPVALVFDQFEEFFVRFRDQPKERAAFISALSAVVNDRSLDFAVVFSLREDYLASLDELASRLPDLLVDRYRVPPLTAFGVRQAVSRPLADAGVGFEPAVVSRLIGQLGEVDYEPALLQILCSELYKAAVHRAGGGVPRVTVADLESLGGRDGVFRRYLQGVADELPPERHLLARMVLDSLITAEGTKRAARLCDILSSGFSAEESEVQEILDWLGSRRLLRREERSGESWYELVHERLVPLLREWLDLDRQFFEFRQARAYVRTTSAGELWRESPDTLLSAETLTNVLRPYRERFRFSSRERELVVRSALYRGSEELPFWAGRQGLDLARGLLLGLLSSGRDTERLAAAVSARRLTDPTGELARACLNSALAEASPQVRWEAGLSLARLARPEDVQALLAARRDPDHGKQVSTALEALAAGGHDLAGVPWYRRWWARHRNRQKALSEQSLTIRHRIGCGMWSGVGAGLLWTVARLAAFVSFKGSTTGFNWSLIGGEFVGIGALVGALTAWAAARRAVILKEEGRWVKALCRNPVSLVLWLGLAAFCGLVVAGKDADGATVAWVLVLWPAFSVLPVAVAQFSRPFVGFGNSPAGTWLGSLLISLGLPALTALWIVEGIRSIQLHPNHDHVSTFLKGRFGEAVASIAFFSFVISVALVRSAARYPVTGALVTSAKRQFPTVVALIALLAVMVSISHEYPGNDFYEGVQRLAQNPPVAVADLKTLANYLRGKAPSSRTAGSPSKE